MCSFCLLEDFVAHFLMCCTILHQKTVLTEMIVIAAQFILDPCDLPVDFMEIAAGYQSYQLIRHILRGKPAIKFGALMPV